MKRKNQELRHLNLKSPALVMEGVRLHLRSDLHLARKAWHMIMGMVMCLIYFSALSRTAAVVTLGCFLGFDLLLETVRLRSTVVNEKLMKVWGPFMRSCEVNRVSGVPYYIAATLLAIGIFPKPIALLSILYLALGDPMASLVGILYGKHGPKVASGKSLIGTTAGIFVCVATTVLFFQTIYPLPLNHALLLAVVGGVAGGTAELLPLDVDDNFSIPVVSGFVLWAAFILLGI